jgi:hypothetical protein
MSVHVRVQMRLSSLALTVFALLGTSLPLVDVAATASAKEARPPKPEELVGAWIGFWEDGEFTRLDLRADFTGYCAFVAPAESISHDSGVDVYRVTRWTVERWKFVVSLTPVDTRNGSIYLKGRVSGHALELEVGGTDGKWKQKLVLNKESRIQASNVETKEKINMIEERK